MAFLDQSYSSKNFRILYDLLNRKGKISIAQVSPEYERIVAEIKEVNKSIKELNKKKRALWTADDKDIMNQKKEKLSQLIEKKDDELTNRLNDFADEVNNHSFQFSISKHVHGNHEEFTVDTSILSSLFALNQIMYNLKNTFKVEMSNRHSIMTSLKHLLNTKMPMYLIRTDVEGFFEHIPQDKLWEKLYNNNLLTYKTKSLIKQILNTYESLKDASVTPLLGVPRGICISSFLSEIYMQDLDRNIKSRKEVIFYARYVDDIFLITTSIYPYEKIEDYYCDLVKMFLEYGLSLKSTDDVSKCQLIDVTKINNSCPTIVYYLGYNLKLQYDKGLITKYDLSDKKIVKLKQRIDNAFRHFENLCKKNIKQARRDLLDALKLITSNIKLYNTKSGVKVGLYYNNDLLDVFDGLNDVETHLKSKSINILSTRKPIFKTSIEETNFKNKLKRKIDCISFQKSWKEKRFYSFTIDRIIEILEWL